MTSKQLSLSKIAVFITAVISLSFPSTKTPASCAAPLNGGDFEAQTNQRISSPWVGEGRVGVDIGLGYSNRGKNNVWMRNVSGWNGIRQRVRLQPNTQYKLTAYIRTSGNVTDGYFGVRDAQQKVFSEIKFGSLPRYTPMTLSFRTGNETVYNIFTGFWALGQDSWVQVDDYSLTGGSCEDVQLVPANN
ncbi:hypothetical protein NIES37_28920 [Tolypothrix tenuis PCC 7101]|uniref:CBM-cenC domain-containing protein n=1 Tax=Tolypothrix tenuis PCC 7101 TaxID=231146 RepID=A0A1Z4MZM3_9CYAN|nr:hypothetical protein [Aulosira sp. FACHB-113]BAY98914.1 hypothetical protein NIES37_28920 [Tolypothrix tenuis PCC 7101]BAZ77167.1 hypothetical protein NIES50_57700 [Aulosira laxa NIES-50]